MDINNGINAYVGMNGTVSVEKAMATGIDINTDTSGDRNVAEGVDKAMNADVDMDGDVGMDIDGSEDEDTHVDMGWSWVWL